MAVLANGSCGANLANATWTLDTNGVLTISGTGDMRNYELNASPWYSYKDSITSLVLSNGITHIGDNSFYNCNNLTGHLIIPDSVITIGIRAFNSTGFTSATIGRNVTTIDNWAFFQCTNLSGYLIIPSSVTSINSGVFSYCNSLDGIYFLGNSPRVNHATSSSRSFEINAMLYYTDGTTGWTDHGYYDANASTWCGYNISCFIGEAVQTNNKYYYEIASAIRSKNGTTTTYKPSEMATAIRSINTIDTATVGQAVPSISISSSGLITASSTQSAGYVSGGTKEATYQLTTRSGTTITPSTSDKTAVSSGVYTTGTVYVAGDSDLKSSNIKSGVSIFGVNGTCESNTISSLTSSEVHVTDDKYVEIDIPYGANVRAFAISHYDESDNTIGSIIYDPGNGCKAVIKDYENDIYDEPSLSYEVIADTDIYVIKIPFKYYVETFSSSDFVTGFVIYN